MNLIGKLVVCETTDGAVVLVGEAVSYADFPTYDVKDGRQHKNWAAHMTREATLDECVAYWKDRAEKAEAGRVNAERQRQMVNAQNAAVTPYNTGNLSMGIF